MTLLTVTATDENGLSTNATIRVEVVLPQAFDGQSVNCPGLVWRTAGAPPWFGQGEELHDGVAGAQSGGAGSWLETTVTGPGTLSFWFKAGSDFNRAGGLFSASCAASGLTGSVWLESTTTWRREQVGLPAGTWVLRWDVYTEPWVEAGAGALWLDEVSFSPGAPACRLELEPESYIGEVGLLLHGEPGAIYDLETSGDLRNWSGLSRIRLDNFVFWYADPNWYAEARFWRLRQVSASRQGPMK